MPCLHFIILYDTMDIGALQYCNITLGGILYEKTVTQRALAILLER